MKTEKRRAFIINFMYYAILFVMAFIIIKSGLSMLSPFVIAFLTAWMLREPIGFAAKWLHMGWKTTAILVVTLFYCTIGVLISLLSVRAFASVRDFVGNLPEIYGHYVEPLLTGFFNSFEQSVVHLDTSLLETFDELEGQFVQSVGQMVSNLSIEAMGLVSGAATSLPGFFINLLLVIVSTYFIAADYDQLTGFCLAQLNEKARTVFFQIKEYVVGTLFVCIRSYALIMSITFAELAVGLVVIGVDNAILISLAISIFDVLPVLGTGGIMIPWIILEALQGDYTLSLGLLLVYLFITVVRNIIEPKIVGDQIGLHPVVTLASMTLGAQLFGVMGLFGFPIGLSLLRHLNENGTIRLYKTAGSCHGGAGSAPQGTAPLSPGNRPENGPDKPDKL